MACALTAMIGMYRQQPENLSPLTQLTKQKYSCCHRQLIKLIDPYS